MPDLEQTRMEHHEQDPLTCASARCGWCWTPRASTSIAAKIGCSAHTLNDWVKNAEIDSGRRAGVPTELAEMAEKMKAMERENRELRQGEEDQKTVRWTVF